MFDIIVVHIDSNTSLISFTLEIGFTFEFE